MMKLKPLAHLYLLTGSLLAATASGAAAQTVYYDDLPPAPSGAASFTIHGNSWGKKNLTYSFINGTSDIANNDERLAIEQAFKLWAEVTPLTFRQVNDPNADILISWGTFDHGDGNDFDGAGGVLAHAYYPPPNSGSLAGDIHFDDSETWTNATRSTNANPFDLVTVAAHEIGHSLGLAHSSVTNSLMFPTYSGSRRFLSQDDIDGIQLIYGEEEVAPGAHYRIQNYWNFNAFININAPGGAVEADSDNVNTDNAEWTFEPVGEYYRIKNVATGEYLHMEDNVLDAGVAAQVPAGWWSSHWAIEAYDGSVDSSVEGRIFRIRNRWQYNAYLHVEHGYLSAGQLRTSSQPADFVGDWWSARWYLEHVQ